MKRRTEKYRQAELNAELLDGWMLVQLLKFGSDQEKRRRLAQLALEAQSLPFKDCSCVTCLALQGQVSGA